MYVDVVPNRGSRPAILLREAHREGKRIVKRTVANLTDWPAARVDALRLVLRGEIESLQQYHVESSLPHGHVEALLAAARKIGLQTLIASKRSRARDLVMAMLLERLIRPGSKLATVHEWNHSTLAEELGVVDATVDEVYGTLDWLLARQGAIQKKLAARHFKDNGLVLYDISSAYYEGSHCTLAGWGHDRDTSGCRIIVFGVITDEDGRPVALDAYPGNTSDPRTVAPQAEALRNEYGLERVVLVGDRGLLTDTQIRMLRDEKHLGWISALRHASIQKLVEGGELQMSLFDRQHLAEIESARYPGERLIVCFNPILAAERRRQRNDLIQATEEQLRELQRKAQTRKQPVAMGTRVARVANRRGVSKLFRITLGEDRFEWSRNQEAIAAEERLDGIYVIRTSEPASAYSADDVVRRYKSLSQVERAFRCLKGIDLLVRPIYLRTESHVRAHLFLCMLAYYLEWHLRRVWQPLLFHDEQLAADRLTRDPVLPAQPSESARLKKRTRTNAQGQTLHSFATLLSALATRSRVTCRLTTANDQITLTRETVPTPLQAEALRLIAVLP
jgi:hypothetical protein